MAQEIYLPEMSFVAVILAVANPGQFFNLNPIIKNDIYDIQVNNREVILQY